MSSTKPRIDVLPEHERSEKQRELLAPSTRNGRTFNVLATVVRHPDLLERWSAFAGHVLGPTSTLSARDREILILRIGWLNRSEYEFGQHVLFARRAGLTDQEIERVKEGATAPGWTAHEATLCRAADDLHGGGRVSDDTWRALAERYDDKQLLDVVFTVGQYNLVSWALNSLGVELDEGVPAGFSTK
ncbi:MAG TPA: carboxymuconolactone decarboxylase family protein [Thermoanaerobaculia bacterium]|nr:carboxymuconolactone decarboxylase family protein [Thermoanaerobaculia bacterium]